MAAAVIDQTSAVDTPPVNKSGPTTAIADDPYYGSTSKWPVAADLAGSTLPCRLEGEIADLVVLGEVPAEIKGTFYRVMVDPALPPVPGNVPLDGDGNISAFRFHEGRVDMKMRYVETERLKLERKAGKSLFGLYRNPSSHHPCVRAAVDSTANTNLILWANHLLALEESYLPYAVDPETLETRGYDPFSGQVKSKSFSAHPKIDPFTDEPVVFGYEAKGLATKDIVIYHLDAAGKKHDEQWISAPWTAIIHDCAITPNFIILFLWPFSADIERMKRGGHHWAWDYALPCTFIVVPRRPGKSLPSGWAAGEHRVYHWRNCMPIHTAGAWEDGDKIYVESSRVHDNAFPFFPTDKGEMPAADAKADYVRWELDLTRPTDTKVPDPQVVLDVPSEFPRVDERFWTKQYEFVWLNVFIPDRSDGGRNIFHGLNGLAQHSHKTRKTEYFYAGDDSLVQEPIFVPRHEGAEEGDGWIMAMVERRKANRNDVVIIDTKDFEKPVAIVQLPFHVKAQVHGNWVGVEKGVGTKSLVREVVGEVKVSGRGALEVEV
ncbi:putative retinal pigment epithelial membrane protein 2 [Elsinoe australis]|uniref:Putative retinal pigment epithelial membrane protein 2 n=1 Tax=Elsinoe australis TaxID=40998 RepID=A0A4U7B229_9PEZI|nr:putative retinal pigment epithelial membrane protein 2 [Elsinoe australis]